MSAPEWFNRNIAVQPDRSMAKLGDLDLETLAWGEVGAPGLLFVHGNGAHADWWSPFAPFFSPDHRVGAFSFSGMGRSDRRSAYSVEVFSEEVLAVSESLALFDSEQKPYVVAHSMGAIIAARAMVAQGDRFAGLIIIDSGVVPPGGWTKLVTRASANPGFETFEEGVARFRLSPTQTGVEPWMLDHIARRSLCQHEGGRWHWCFDPQINDDLGIKDRRLPDYDVYVQQAKCPLAFVWGEESFLIGAPVRDYTRQIAPAGTRFVHMPAAHHHLMLDNPIAFVSTLRALMA